MSVPGRIGSHQSAFSAAVLNLGSTTSSLAPRASPLAKAVIWLVKTFSPRWLPISTISLASSRSTGSGEPSPLPKVSA